MTKMTHPLAWDCFRCKPVEPDGKCHNCKRWHDHPDQTFGPRTAFIQIEGSKSEACCHFPVSLLKEKT